MTQLNDEATNALVRDQQVRAQSEEANRNAGIIRAMENLRKLVRASRLGEILRGPSQFEPGKWSERDISAACIRPVVEQAHPIFSRRRRRPWSGQYLQVPRASLYDRRFPDDSASTGRLRRLHGRG